MAPSFDALRVRLIQIRDNPVIEQEEQETFLERCELRKHQLVTTSVLRDPLTSDILQDVDAVLIGGAGAHSAANDYEWMPGLADLIKRCCDMELPLFGSCWGHQFIARALGGEVIHDAERSELGCHTVFLTDEGVRDPLFQHFPPEFLTNQGHQDRVSVLPQDAVELAWNNTAPFQAFRIDGLPVYGTQFHSELDAARERDRLLAYRDYYPELRDETVFQSVLCSLAETPDVDRLLHWFLLEFAVIPQSNMVSRASNA